MQFFKPENYFEVRKALEQAGRQDLIGPGCDSLIPLRPPKEALEARRRDANKRFRGDYVHNSEAGVGNDGKSGKKNRGKNNKQSRSGPGKGYRPDRKSK